MELKKKLHPLQLCCTMTKMIVISCFRQWLWPWQSLECLFWPAFLSAPVFNQRRRMIPLLSFRKIKLQRTHLPPSRVVTIWKGFQQVHCGTHHTVLEIQLPKISVSLDQCILILAILQKLRKISLHHLR
uniref:Uncharacterized protein n=1 Tax=Opuntia streptacantha TaxID=393608 RepID=A0A7C9DPS6_OPUST